MSNSKKGAYKLADVLQKRMNEVSGRNISVSSELGTIVQGDKLKLDSLPDVVLNSDDYSVCEKSMIEVVQDIKSIEPLKVEKTKKLKTGDRVLVIWTGTGEPVVVDRLI